jgi:plastocyanin
MDKESQPNGAIWLLIVLVMVIFAGALLYFGKNNPDIANSGQILPSNSPSARTPKLYTVFYDLGIFSPTNIRVHVGDSVKFQNDSRNPVRIISDSTGGIVELPGFDSSVEVPPGSSFAFTFNKAGTFGYHNAQQTDEEGTVIVKP